MRSGLRPPMDSCSKSDHSRLAKKGNGVVRESLKAFHPFVIHANIKISAGLGLWNSLGLC